MRRVLFAGRTRYTEPLALTHERKFGALRSVLDNTTGVYSRAWDTERVVFTARGFDIDNLMYDGIPVEKNFSFNTGSIDDTIDTALYERIEIVRGATGLMTGAGNPAAAINLVPTSTGAARAIGLVLPHLKGKLDGMSMRAPVPTGSVTDLVVELRQEASVDAVNQAFEAAASSGPLAPYLDYSTAPLVSTDIVNSPASCTFDSGLTMATGTSAKVFGWYDNEWGYSCRLVDLVSKIL